MGNGDVRADDELPAAWFVARKRGLAIGIVNIGVCLGLSLANCCSDVYRAFCGRALALRMVPDGHRRLRLFIPLLSPGEDKSA